MSDGENSFGGSLVQITGAQSPMSKMLAFEVDLI